MNKQSPTEALKDPLVTVRRSELRHLYKRIWELTCELSASKHKQTASIKNTK